MNEINTDSISPEDTDFFPKPPREGVTQTRDVSVPVPVQ